MGVGGGGGGEGERERLFAEHSRHSTMLFTVFAAVSGAQFVSNDGY